MRPKRDSVSSMEEIKRMSIKEHRLHSGVTETIGKVPLRSLRDLAVFYTPGVAYASLAIKKDREMSYALTNRANRIAIVSNGSRILGLGNIGPEAGYPVMEGKALLFKKFGDVDAVPITISAETTDEIVDFVKKIQPAFGGINIEDIASPTCFEVVDKLNDELDIPVFHDDRQGTAIVALAGLKNALKLVGKKISEAKIAVNGVGAAGIGIAQLLITAGAKDLVMIDRAGIVYDGRERNMNPTKESLAKHTNKKRLMGGLRDAVKGADVLIGASERGAFRSRFIKLMADKPIVFALANPEPEMSYYAAKSAGAKIVATGMSGVPNQINNLLAFPAVFRGALDIGARKINMQMQIAAADALAKSVPQRMLSDKYIIPDFADEDMTKITANVAAAVARSAIETGVARKKMSETEIRRNIEAKLKRYQRIEDFVSRLG